MTTIIKSASILLAIFGTSFIVTQCTTTSAEGEQTKKDTESKPATSGITIPKMQERKASFGSPEERDQLLDIYDNARLQLEANENNLSAQLRMAEVFIQEARVTGDFGYNYEAASTLLENVIATAGANKDALFQALTHQATIKLSEHQFKEALAIGEQALAINQHNAGIYGVMVDANVELGNYEEAVKMSDQMVNIRPDLRSYSRISYLREIHGQNEGAIEAMKLAVSAGYPGFEETSWCRVTLGGLYEKAGDLTNAEMQFQLALQERENYPYALAALGRIEMKKSNYETAEELLNKAISYIPNAGFYADLAKVHGLNGKMKESNEAMKQAFVALGGDASDHHHSHDADGGHSHSHGNDHSHGHSHEVGLEMARMYLEFTTDYDKALTNALFEYEIRPENIEVNHVLAGIYYMQKDLVNADKHLQKAFATQVQNSELDCLAGLISIENGDEAKGKELIQQSFAANPFQNHTFVESAKAYL